MLQRFEWHGVKEKIGFLLTRHEDKASAELHFHYLNVNEGKMLQMPDDAEKMATLLKVGLGCRIFLNKIKVEHWNNRMLNMYEKEITQYLRTKTKFYYKNPIDITFSLIYGRDIATITDGKTSKTAFALDLLR